MPAKPNAFRRVTGYGAPQPDPIFRKCFEQPGRVLRPRQVFPMQNCIHQSNLPHLVWNSFRIQHSGPLNPAGERSVRGAQCADKKNSLDHQSPGPEAFGDAAGHPRYGHEQLLCRTSPHNPKVLVWTLHQVVSAKPHNEARWGIRAGRGFLELDTYLG
jgi:hypothetical protein